MQVALAGKISVAKRERLSPERHEFDGRANQRRHRCGSNGRGTSRRKTSAHYQCADNDCPKTIASHRGSPCADGPSSRIRCLFALQRHRVVSREHFPAIIANRLQQDKTATACFPEPLFSVGAGVKLFRWRSSAGLARIQTHLRQLRAGEGRKSLVLLRSRSGLCTYGVPLAIIA